MLRVVEPIERAPIQPLQSTAIFEETAGRAVSSVLKEIVTFTEFARQIFDDLLIEAKDTGSKISELSGRVEAVRAGLPSIEMNMYTSTNKMDHFSQFGIEYRPEIKETTDIFDHQIDADSGAVTGLTNLMLQKYMAARPAPALNEFNKFVDGQNCLRKYTNPEFFKEQWVKAMQEQHAREVEIRKQRREARRLRKKKETDKTPKKVAVVKRKKYSALGAEFEDDDGPQSPAKLTSGPTSQEQTAAVPLSIVGPRGSSRVPAAPQPSQPQSQPQPQRSAAATPSAGVQPVTVQRQPSTARPPTQTTPVAAPLAVQARATVVDQQPVNTAAPAVKRGGPAAPPPPALSSESAAPAATAPAAATDGAAVRRGGPPAPSVDSAAAGGAARRGGPAPPPPPQLDSPASAASAAGGGAVRRGGPAAPPPPVLSSASPAAAADGGAVRRGGPAAPPPPALDLASGLASVTLRSTADSETPKSAASGTNSHDALMAAIRGGAGGLKKVDTSSPKPPPPPQALDQRSMLMTQIQQGITLRKASDRKLAEKPKPAGGPRSIAEILAATIRPAMSGGSDADSASEDEWDD